MDTCSYEGCTNPVRSRGLCRSHYTRLLKFGDPTPRNGGPGTGEARQIVSLPRQLDRAVRRAARREGLTLAAWWRSAAADRVARSERAR